MRTRCADALQFRSVNCKRIETKERAASAETALSENSDLLFDDVRIKCSQDIAYVAVSVDVQVDRFGKIQTENTHD